jgi:intracellular sulfur oxidation DsrE/DsrF family protein
MRGLMFGLMCCLVSVASAEPEVDELIAAGEAPPGVLFEIIESDEDALSWALPRVIALSERLRQRYPGLPIAIVSHGPEQFGLLSSNRGGAFDRIHAEAEGLQGREIDLHICGVHAGWYGHDADDFPAYVDVAVSGPAQMRDYQNFGYVLIPLRGDD